ncbi:hypothetical protein H6F93_04645 [Leptolyngbya sp. FACHB-671]|uniref:hypothetical protein n=1 Tax=Cyanophyceae TaxID=3028117 RepID=UPI00168233D0|nr:MULTISPECIES: hypothetical protein [Cyanophyceae]MBD2066822.1 hypothetical protein [Leptolyngbya sp. FACHB-671]
MLTLTIEHSSQRSSDAATRSPVIVQRALGDGEYPKWVMSFTQPTDFGHCSV